jgi:hypothetical protein
MNYANRGSKLTALCCWLGELKLAECVVARFNRLMLTECLSSISELNKEFVIGQGSLLGTFIE